MKNDGAEASAVLPHLCHRLAQPRDGRVLEELGTYDPLIPNVDARVLLNHDRMDYWLGVGAKPSEKVTCSSRSTARRERTWSSKRPRASSWRCPS